MDDSDDYFQDSLVLDENDLAILDAAEATYAQSASGPSTKSPISPPAAKRQKTIHVACSWDDDGPDIVLQADGSYGLNLRGQPGIVELDGVGIGGINEARLTDSFGFGPVSVVDKSSNLQTGSTAQQLKGMQDARPQAMKSVTDRNDSPEVIVQHGRRTERTVAHIPKESNESSTGFTDSDLQRELAILRTQLDDINREYQVAQEKLKDAEVARYAKDGEVSILRKTIEKAAQQHAEDLAKLRETKEAASAEQARLQKDMKEQMERLRTEFIFKQHELEASARKPTWSTRSKKTGLVVPFPSPVPIPQAMKSWTPSQSAGPSSANHLKEFSFNRHPVDEERPLQVRSPQRPVKTRHIANELNFPGFENSFVQSTPIRSPRRKQGQGARETSAALTPRRKDNADKGKTPLRGQGANGFLSPARMPPLSLMQSPKVMRESLPEDDFIQEFDADIEMANGSPGKDVGRQERESSPIPDFIDNSSIIGSEFMADIDKEQMREDETFKGIDWREELHFLLLTHTCKAAKTLSFHHLLAASFPPDARRNAETYHGACSSVLETLGTKYKLDTIEKVMAGVAEGFLIMAFNLWEARCFRHLNVLFELLTSISAYIPGFTRALLLAGQDDTNVHMWFSGISCAIGSSSLQLRDREVDEECVLGLLNSFLSLLEMVAWTMSDSLCHKFDSIPKHPRALITLLDATQPVDVILRTIRMLVVLATHPLLSKSLASNPNLLGPNSLLTPRTDDPTRIPLIERMATFLIGPDSSLGDSAYDCASSVLNFFGLVSVTTPIGRDVLLKSNTLIPSIVLRLSNLTTLIWEDDEGTMQSTERAARAVRHTIQALHLLHRLVIPSSSERGDAPPSDFDFRYKLHHVPHSTFSGLTHMFTVMIGRLSYAEPPDWLSQELQNELEKVTEPARDLMDLIIVGPEGDSVWVAYQDVDAESVTENDDEMEDHFLGNE